MLGEIENKLLSILSEDIGKLILRIFVGTLMLLHGIHKLYGGIDGIKHLINSSGIPEIVAYGIYVGEVIAPIFLILGLYSRLSAFMIALSMGFAIFLAHGSSIFVLSHKSGGLLIELPLIYLISSITIVFIGGGKYSLRYRS